MPTAPLSTVSGVLLASNVTHDEAVAISDFARRPLVWNGVVIGLKYS